MSDQRHVRLFRNGRNQAVRIPVEFELPGNEAIMHRDGDRLVIEPVRKRGLVALLKSMEPVQDADIEAHVPGERERCEDGFDGARVEQFDQHAFQRRPFETDGR